VAGTDIDTENDTAVVTPVAFNRCVRFTQIDGATRFRRSNMHGTTPYADAVVQPPIAADSEGSA